MEQICKAAIQNLIQSGGKSCWVSDNKYDVFEIAQRGKTNGLVGEFLVLAQNKSFNYWVLTKLSYNINYKSTQKNIMLADRAYFNPIGLYDITYKENSLVIYKKAAGRKANYGYSNPSGKFDEIGARKKAYGTSTSQLLANQFNMGKISQNSISGGAPVPVYKHRKEVYRNRFKKPPNIRGYLK